MVIFLNMLHFYDPEGFETLTGTAVINSEHIHAHWNLALNLLWLWLSSPSITWLSIRNIQAKYEKLYIDFPSSSGFRLRFLFCDALTWRLNHNSWSLYSLTLSLPGAGLHSASLSYDLCQHTLWWMTPAPSESPAWTPDLSHSLSSWQMGARPGRKPTWQRSKPAFVWQIRIADWCVGDRLLEYRWECRLALWLRYLEDHTGFLVLLLEEVWRKQHLSPIKLLAKATG